MCNIDNNDISDPSMMFMHGNFRNMNFTHIYVIGNLMN